MGERTGIAWTDATWNPVRGCSRVSEGCRFCYAERQAVRSVRGANAGFVKSTPDGPRWTGKVELVPERLDQPLRWRRPRRIFVNSMSDLFHEALPDEAIDRVFAVMALSPRHTFQVLTKRPERMLRYLVGHRLCYEDFVGVAQRFVGPDCDVDGVIDSAFGRYHDGLPNLWLGVSVEDQASFNERIEQLIQVPAAVRFLSIEPLLESVDLGHVIGGQVCSGCRGFQFQRGPCRRCGFLVSRSPVQWVIVGGESGPGARPCDVAWIRDVVQQCRGGGVPVFVKQLGARPIASASPLAAPQSAESIMRHGEYDPDPLEYRFLDRKGGDPSEWPADLRVREFPEARS